MDDAEGSKTHDEPKFSGNNAAQCIAGEARIAPDAKCAESGDINAPPDARLASSRMTAVHDEFEIGGIGGIIMPRDGGDVRTPSVPAGGGTRWEKQT
ncbi:hypothetical protein GCM10011503_31120 [Henriciella pelagia]|uniref:Uncharacterized protein n=1 Tax=Henriciella pelagia TaxID=1977912 RepID=A0ABQ1K058_9PROT|nr:hypothetical protein GCM10011503_31120 [Henriciella pelagia]